MNSKPTIGMIGLGRMGQAIIEQLKGRDDLDFCPVSRLNEANLKALQGCDVVIEFTLPEVAPDIVSQCILAGIPVVSGTTGWHEKHLDRIISLCTEKQGKLLYATNFSIGMNIVFALNEKLAQVMKQYPDFKPSLKEIHHIHKKDMPSGTAMTLLKGIILEQDRFTGFNLNDENASANNIDVHAIREGEVKGYHEVTWNSGLEKITLGHEAFDRGIFAAGAIVAAEWLVKQEEGVYTMRDIIRL